MSHANFMTGSLSARYKTQWGRVRTAKHWILAVSIIQYTDTYIHRIIVKRTTRTYIKYTIELKIQYKI